MGRLVATRASEDEAMKVLSLFSGVGGMDLGLERAGHEVVGMCEIDQKARSVLARHRPNVPIHDDVTTLDTEGYRGRVDLVAGGSPCQDLSVAGKRAGLAGQRSGLFWHQCRIADGVAAPWVIWENVAGALTSNNGADFAAVLWGITGALPRLPDGTRWGTSGVVVGPKRTAVWRLLDAQYFGVAQRRRRVFIVAGPRNLCGPEILLESESVCGNPAPSRTSKEGTAGAVEDGVAGSLGARNNRNDLDTHGAYIAIDQVFPTTNATDGTKWGSNQWVDNGKAIPVAVHEDQRGNMRLSNVSYSVSAKGGKPGQGYQAALVPVPISFGWQENQLTGQHRADGSTDPLTYTKTLPVSAPEQRLRRLSPRECERLMGWPDDWTRWDDTGTEIADTHRYRFCGNGVVSNVAEWIGRRLP